MNSPNFFIVGAGKCGTTAMHTYLSSHPEIFMSSLKEPQFFADGYPRRTIECEKKYLELFKNAEEQHTIVGEATPIYILYPESLQRINEFDSSAKILFMVRNPRDMFLSYHQMLVTNLWESETNPEKAWRLQSLRRNIPPKCPDRLFLQYRTVASLGTQLRRLKSIFPRQQIKTVVFDDFVGHTSKVYSEVLDFLGVRCDGRTQFPKVNGRRQPRSRILRFLLDHERIPESLRAHGRTIGLHSIHRAIMKLNLVRARRPDLGPHFIRELDSEFAEEVQALEMELNRDLRHWAQVDKQNG